MGARNYRDLVAWQKAMDFVTNVYAATANFPAEELYGLRSQLRRCAVSIPSNIAEGQGRETNGDFRHFLAIAHGSLREAETQVFIATRLNYLDQSTQQDLLDAAAEVGRLITGLRKALANK